MSLRSLFERLLYATGYNPFDRLLHLAAKKKAKSSSHRILLCWNRGLGDIPLGLYAMLVRIEKMLPGARVTFLTREGLKEGFSLFPSKGLSFPIEILIAPEVKRGESLCPQHILPSLSRDVEEFDLIIEKPDPTKWVRWQLGRLIPCLSWDPKWDFLYEAFGLDPKECYIGAHVDAESGYALWRNWPISHWRALFIQIAKEKKGKILLFGFKPNEDFQGIENVIDLRGKTPLFSLLSLIQHCCDALIVPDSGIGTMTYFLPGPFPLRLISLWADPNMGILKQNVPSPNPSLSHIPLIAPVKNLSSVSPSVVYEALCPIWKS